MEYSILQPIVSKGKIIMVKDPYDCIRYNRSPRLILFYVKLCVSLSIARMTDKASHNDLLSFRKRRCLQKKPIKGIII